MKMNIKNLLVACAVISIFFSCGQEDEMYQLNTKLVQLNCDRTFALEVTPALLGLTYTSLNTNIATVSADGVIKAKLVGTTKILVKDLRSSFIDTVKVVVNTLYTSFYDPYLGFGADKETIIKVLNVSDYDYYESTPYNRLIIDNGDVTDFKAWTYYLSKDNKLLFSQVGIDNNGMLDTHMTSRYNLLKTFQYSVFLDSYYINPDSSLIVLDRRANGLILTNIYYYLANKERTQRILSEVDGESLYAWLYNYYQE